MRKWRLRKHDGEADELRADVDSMRGKLDAIWSICEEAGATATSAAADAVDGVPPHLIAASRTRTAAGGEPVRIALGAAQAIAVVTPAGAPEAVWAEIRAALREAAAPGPVVRLGHARYPAGLSALAVPGEITVSSAIPAAEQRAALRTALKAARRAGWLPGAVPAFLLPKLAFRHLVKAIAVKSAIAAGGAAVVAGGVATAVFATGYVPYRGQVPDGIRRLPPAVAQHHADYDWDPPAAAPRRHHDYPELVPFRVITAIPAPRQSPGSPSPGTSQTGSPSPSPSASSPSPAPSPSPSSSPGSVQSPGLCVVVLGVKVCV